MATVTDFQARFPEFVEEDILRIQLFLDDAALMMNYPEKWLEYYDVAHQYLAAHLLTVASFTAMGDATPIAPVKRQEVDDVVVENAVNSVDPTADDLYSTSYGKSHLRYRKLCFTGIYGV